MGMVGLRRKWQVQRARMGGVTLLELMIVVAIVGILAAISYPSYRAQIIKTHRTDGKTTLMQLSQQLERCYTRFSTYAGCPTVAFPFTSQDGYYIVTATTTATAYTLDATPQGAQTNDGECAALRLKSTGEEGSQGADTDANGCW